MSSLFFMHKHPHFTPPYDVFPQKVKMAASRYYIHILWPIVRGSTFFLVRLFHIFPERIYYITYTRSTIPHYFCIQLVMCKSHSYISFRKIVNLGKDRVSHIIKPSLWSSVIHPGISYRLLLKQHNYVPCTGISIQYNRYQRSHK